MKNFQVNLEDRLQLGIVSSWSFIRGRLMKGGVKKRAGKLDLRELENKFYLKVANLKENEFSDFIRNYQVTLPSINGNIFASPEDIKKFQNDIKQIIENIEKYKDLHKNKIAMTQQLISIKTDDLIGLINKYINNCYLQIDLPPILRQPPSEEDFEDFKKYTRQVQSSTEENLGGRETSFFNRYDGRTNFTNLVCRCDSLLSWCVLDLIADLLVRDEMIRICSNCGRPFEAQDQREKYCRNKACQAERASKRRQKSRNKK
jgi:hypothetical protein